MGEIWSIVKASATVLSTNPALLFFISLILDVPILILQLSGPFLINYFKDDIAKFLVKLERLQLIALVLVLFICLTMISVLLRAISNSSLFFTMAHFYLSPSKPISKTEALNLSPRIWFRNWSTNLWTLFMTIIVAIISVMVSLLGYFVFKIPLASAFYLSFLLIQPVTMYISMVTALASVASVLEDVQGLKALSRGNRLLKGKIWLGLRVMALTMLFSLPLVYLITSLSLWKLPLGVVVGSLVWLVVASLEVVFFFTCDKAASITVHEDEFQLLKFKADQEFV